MRLCKSIGNMPDNLLDVIDCHVVSSVCSPVLMLLQLRARLGLAERNLACLRSHAGRPDLTGRWTGWRGRRSQPSRKSRWLPQKNINSTCRQGLSCIEREKRASASGIWEGGEHRGRIEVVEKSTFHGVKTLYPIADKRNLLINPSCYQHLFMSHLVKQLPWKKVERNPWITSQRQICQICIDLLDMYTTQTYVLPELLRVCVGQWHLRRDFLHGMPKNNIGHWKSWKECSHEPLLRVRCSAVRAFPVQFWEWKAGRTAIKSKLLAPSLAACQWQTLEDSVTASYSRTFHPSRHGSDLLDRPTIPLMPFTESKGFHAAISRKQTWSPGHQTGSAYDRAKLLRQCHEWTRDSFEILSGCCAEVWYLQIEIYIVIIYIL